MQSALFADSSLEEFHRNWHVGKGWISSAASFPLPFTNPPLFLPLREWPTVAMVLAVRRPLGAAAVASLSERAGADGGRTDGLSPLSLPLSVFTFACTRSACGKQDTYPRQWLHN